MIWYIMRCGFKPPKEYPKVIVANALAQADGLVQAISTGKQIPRSWDRFSQAAQVLFMHAEETGFNDSAPSAFQSAYLKEPGIISPGLVQMGKAAGFQPPVLYTIGSSPYVSRYDYFFVHSGWAQEL